MAARVTSTGTSTTDTQLQTDLEKLQTDTPGDPGQVAGDPGALAAVRDDFQKIHAAATRSPTRPSSTP